MKLDEQKIIQLFQQRELGKEYFDHRGHLYLAWVHLKHFDFAEANQRVSGGINALARLFGAPEKYHHTLTHALMRIVFYQMQQAGSISFEDFLQQNPVLLENAESILAKHYSFQELNSEQAKTGWVEPDRMPLPPLSEKNKQQ